MPTRNISLTADLDNFIASGIEDGHYSDASEAVCEGLRLLAQRDAEDRAKIEWLRGATQEGIEAINRGEYVTLTSPEAIAKHLHGLRVSK